MGLRGLAGVAQLGAGDGESHHDEIPHFRSELADAGWTDGPGSAALALSGASIETVMK